MDAIRSALSGIGGDVDSCAMEPDRRCAMVGSHQPTWGSVRLRVSAAPGT